MGTEAVTAAILVGGQSRRMGTNKALMRLQPDGSTVIDTVLQTLRQVTDEVELVGNPTAAYDMLQLPWVTDRFPQAGPLAGIHAALNGARTDHVLVVACDLPFLNVELLRFMVQQPRSYDVLVPEVGQLQPLHAIYAGSCLPSIERYLRAGRYQVQGWFDEVAVQVIGQSVVEQYDPTLRSSFNLNTPEDLVRARKMS